MQISGRLWLLMARSLNDEATIQEREELDNMLRQDTSLQQQYDLLYHIWSDRKKHDKQTENFSVNKAVSKIFTLAELEAIQFNDEVPQKRKSFRKRRILFPSLIVLIIVSVIFIWKYTRPSLGIPKSQETIAVQNGSRSRSLLPDGSTVWLNVGSKLFYNNDNFSGTTREVRLEGEAFFDVVKQPQHPFIVHTSGIDIKVLGTSFNVKSYPDDKNVETTLYHGSVKIFRENESERSAIILKPNEKVIIPKEAAIVNNHLSVKNNSPVPATIPATYTLTHIDSTKKESERIETAWVFSRLEFEKESFEEVARKMERWYNVTIYFTDEKVKQLSVTGSFGPETIEQALAALKVGFPTITCKVINHEIYVGSSE